MKIVKKFFEKYPKGNCEYNSLGYQEESGDLGGSYSDVEHDYAKGAIRFKFDEGKGKGKVKKEVKYESDSTNGSINRE